MTSWPRALQPWSLGLQPTLHASILFVQSLGRKRIEMVLIEMALQRALSAYMGKVD